MRGDHITHEIEILRDRIDGALDREPELAGRARRALALLSSAPPDPANSLTESRRAIEYLLLELHRMHEIAPPMQLSRMIDNLFQNDKFKSAIFNDSTLAIRLRLSFQKIRELGNTGTGTRRSACVPSTMMLL
jgi:hypothetical protein